jgi:type II secretory pathway pseudopilin PulG
MNSKRNRLCAKCRAGFSLIEAIVVVAIIMILATSVAMIQFQATTELLDADAALTQVVGQLRLARQIAIDQRRNVQLQFISTNNVQIIRQDDSTNTTTIADVTLPSGYSFGFPSGSGDTPDGFGNSAAVDLGGGTTGLFMADGTFVDGSNALVNGTVFTMGPTVATARAVTLSGATGRVKQYAWRNSAWEQL